MVIADQLDSSSRIAGAIGEQLYRAFFEKFPRGATVTVADCEYQQFALAIRRDDFHQHSREGIIIRQHFETTCRGASLRLRFG